MLTTLALALFAHNAQAVPVGHEPTHELECSIRCERGGWRIEVYKAIDTSAWNLQFWPANEIWTFGSDMNQAGDTYLGHQVAPYDNLVGGPYCENYPTSGGYYINGAVYQRQYSSEWTAVSTDDLYLGGNPCTDYSDHMLLNVLDTYGIQSGDLPTSCTDIDCASGTGGGNTGGGPGGTPWTYTDAAGNEIEFPDILDGNGGINPTSPYEQAEPMKEDISTGDSGGGTTEPVRATVRRR